MRCGQVRPLKSSDLVLATHGHLRVVTRGNDRPKKGPRFATSPITREAEHRLVQGAENCTCYQVQPRSLAGPRTFRCSTMRIAETFVSTRPGPALPGITGSKREFCTPSPTPVQPAPGSPNTCRTGMMPKPPANRSDEPQSQNPRPLHQSVSPVDVPHDEQ